MSSEAVKVRRKEGPITELSMNLWIIQSTDKAVDEYHRGMDALFIWLSLRTMK